MKPVYNFRNKVLQAAIFVLFAAGTGKSFAQPSTSPPATNEIRIVELQGSVEVSPAGATVWTAAQINQVLHPLDRVHTADNSRVALRWSDQSVVPFGASTELEILPPDSPDAQAGLHLVRGIISFFHRDQPGRIRIITRGAVAGVEGTEFVLAANDAGRTTLSVMDGRVKFGNAQATLLLTNGEQAVTDLGQPPVRTAGFIANNLLQWCFYYPAVIDPDELQLTADEQKNLSDSLTAYRAGDLPAALAKFPAGNPASAPEKIYHAALLLSVGEVEKAEAALAALAKNSGRTERLANSLRQLIAAVKRQPSAATGTPQLASELLAGSYFEQSRAGRDASLQNALRLAKQAAAVSPKFGFAWERAAELEFSFGRTKDALAALDQSLALAPLNAQALALKGFILTAQNQPQAARGWFDRALAADSALGNAWLGRGLVRIRLGDLKGGREDLLVAAALEPQRAELRSYLGKAYAGTGDDAHATKELALAKKLDPNDPTAWLYSALENQRNNRINDAIRDLEKSQALNDNRSVYRSQLLLDQDQAVRSASLAGMYKDAGMTDVSLREAGRAVNCDYANYSAHLFLGDSYSNLRDSIINNRYESPAVTEYFIANLLAPAGAGVLSPAISQQEYTKLFEQNRVGVVSDTKYLSRGAWSETGVQYGTFDNFSYSFEGDYQTDPGQRPNAGLDNRFYNLSLKYQLTPQDGLWAGAQWSRIQAGDTAEYYNQNYASRTFRQQQEEEPTVEIGYHHEWSPGVHTLFLGARIDANLNFKNFTQPTLLFDFPDNGAGVPTLISAQTMTMNEVYSGNEKVYSGELQQIWEAPEHTTIVGTRVQYGHIHTATEQDNPFPCAAFFPPWGQPSWETNVSSLFQRFSVYGYHQWQILEPLQLIGGIAYDHLTFPENFLMSPVSGQDKTMDKFSPKAGLIWTPRDKSTVRFAYTRSLAGANVDQSFQLEPSQVAGFVQSFTSLIPESIAGGNGGAEFETYDLSLEQKFDTGTYLAVSAQLLNSTVHRTDGAFYYYPDELDYPFGAGTHENLDYTEQSLQFTVNQLLGRDWALGARYRLSQAVFNDAFPDVPNNLPQFQTLGSHLQPHQRTEGLLHQLDLTAIYNHPSGFFAEGESLFFDQHNHGYTSPEPGDAFWQLNAFAGYRFHHRHAEVTVGLLNLTDQNYQLNPLNLYNELPRSRTLLVRFRLNF